MKGGGDMMKSFLFPVFFPVFLFFLLRLSSSVIGFSFSSVRAK